MPFFDYKQERQLGQVRMMFQRGNFAYTAIQEIGAYILELPYATSQSSVNRNSGGNSDPSSIVYEDRVSMIVVLPKKGQEIFTTIDKVNTYGMEKLFKELKKVKEEYEDDEVEVFLPRFEMETSLNLVEALENVSAR
jgi:serine protease inhibitor